MQKKLIYVFSFVTVLLLGYIGYTKFFPRMSREEVKKETVTLKKDYEFLKKDLELNLNIVDSSNTLIFAQKKRIEELLGKSELTEEELNEAKTLMREISKNVIGEYKKQLSSSKTESHQLSLENEKSKEYIENLNSKIVALENQKKEITTKYIYEKKESDRKSNLLSYASNLSLSNFVLTGFKVRSSGKEIETEKARRIDKIKMSFDINDNILADSGKKELYIIIHKPDGTLATFENRPSGKIRVDGKLLQFSDKVYIDYEKNVTKNVEFEWLNNDFKKGNYAFDIYENNFKKISKIGGTIKKLE